MFNPLSRLRRQLPLPQWEPFPPTQPPAKRNFQRIFALRRFKTRNLPLGNQIVVYKAKSNAVAKQKESAHVTVSTLLFLCTISREPQGCLRGRSPSVGKGFTRETLGFPLCVFFLLQSVFFLARARKKMRWGQLAATARKNFGPWATARNSVIRSKERYPISFRNSLPSPRHRRHNHPTVAAISLHDCCSK